MIDVSSPPEYASTTFRTSFLLTPFLGMGKPIKLRPLIVRASSRKVDTGFRLRSCSDEPMRADYMRQPRARKHCLIRTLFSIAPQGAAPARKAIRRLHRADPPAPFHPAGWLTSDRSARA